MMLNEVVKKILWVDDLRNPPAGLQCDIARTYYEAIDLLSKVDYDEIYLDHDLGDTGTGSQEKTGYSVCLWLAERKNEGGHVPDHYHILTANPVGRKNMEGVIRRYLV